MHQPSPSIVSIITAAERPLVSLDDVKDELGITDRKSDRTLRRWINDASDVIAAYTHRTFRAHTVSELIRTTACEPRHHDQRRDRLLLSRGPILSVTSIEENDTALDPALYEIDAGPAWVYRLSGGSRSVWSATKIVVVYRAGWASLDDLPGGVRQACMTMVANRKAAQFRDPNLKSERLRGVLEREWWVPTGGKPSLPDDIAVLLDPFVEPNV